MYRASASDFFRVCQGPRFGLSTARLDSLAYSMSRKEPSGTCKVERGFVPLAQSQEHPLDLVCEFRLALGPRQMVVCACQPDWLECFQAPGNLGAGI